MSFPFFPFTEHVSEFLHWQKRWSGATFLAGEACDRLNATHRYEGKDYYMGCIWFSWPALSGFRITKHSSEWKDGISLLRRTSFLSGAPWCTEPPLGSLPRATALCSMPATSRRENTTPHTYQWLPTQVSQTYNVCVSPTQQYCFSFFFFFLILLCHKASCAFISPNTRRCRACIWSRSKLIIFAQKRIIEGVFLL